MSAYFAQYAQADDAFKESRVHTADDGDLMRWLQGLANQPVRNETIQHRDVIRGITINAELAKRHLDKIDKNNRRIQCMFLALTVASLVVGGVQIYYAWKQASPAASPASGMVESPGASSAKIPALPRRPTVARLQAGDMAPVSRVGPPS